MFRFNLFERPYSRYICRVLFTCCTVTEFIIGDSKIMTLRHRNFGIYNRILNRLRLWYIRRRQFRLFLSLFRDNAYLFRAIRFRNALRKRIFCAFPYFITDRQRIKGRSRRISYIVENIVNISFFQGSRHKIILSCGHFTYFTA